MLQVRLGAHVTVRLTDDDLDGAWRARTSLLLHTRGTEIQIFHRPAAT